MAAKGDFLHGKLDETESLLRLENYYRDLAYGNSVTLQYYREQNADLFDAWEQTYHDKTYTLYTDSLSLDYALLSQHFTRFYPHVFLASLLTLLCHRPPKCSDKVETDITMQTKMRPVEALCLRQGASLFIAS